MSSIQVDAVVVTYNSENHIRPCLDSLQKSGATAVVVDNGSQDGTLRIVREEFPTVCVVETGTNLGYGAAVNLGATRCASQLVLVANADTVFPEGSLRNLAQFVIEHPQVGVAGPQQLFPNGDWQRSYGDVQGLWEVTQALIGVTSLRNMVSRGRFRRFRSPSPKSVGYVDGAVMLIRRAAFDEVAGFDAGLHYYCEDADLCLRLRRAGWSVFTVPSVHVTHVRGGSSTRVEGYSERLLRTQAQAYYQLVRKYHSRGYWWLYRHLCILHARKMSLIYRLLRDFGPTSNSHRVSTMTQAFERWARILAELKG